jgi:hypothetical protein
VPLETLVVSPLGAVLNHLSFFFRLEWRRVRECPLGCPFLLAPLLGSAEAFAHTCQRRWILGAFKDSRDGRESALIAGFEPGKQAFELFVMLQQHGHGDDLEGPWTRQIHPSLNVELGAVEETIKSRLIVLTQRASKWGPGPAFVLDELAEGWKRSTHKISPPTVRTLHDGRRG